MSIQESMFQNVPEYYPWMHLDGYTPEQIQYAHKRRMLETLEPQSEDTEIKITSEVNVK